MPSAPRRATPRRGPGRTPECRPAYRDDVLQNLEGRGAVLPSHECELQRKEHQADDQAPRGVGAESNDLANVWGGHVNIPSGTPDLDEGTVRRLTFALIRPTIPGMLLRADQVIE
jgi:hypothetical protein